MCPIPAGTYTMHNTVFTISELSGLWSWLAEVGRICSMTLKFDYVHWVVKFRATVLSPVELLLLDELIGWVMGEFAEGW